MLHRLIHFITTSFYSKKTKTMTASTTSDETTSNQVRRDSPTGEKKKSDHRPAEEELLVHEEAWEYDDELHIPVMRDIDVDLLAERCLRLLKHSESEDHNVSRCSEFNRFNQVFVGIGGTPGSG